MSLPILVAIVVAGIALCVAAVHFTGGSKKAVLADAGAALDRFSIDYPDERAARAILTRDRSTAFLILGQGRMGIVHAVGDCFLTRIVTPADIAGAAADGGDAMRLRFKDFTWKGGRFVFSDSAEVRALLAVFGVTANAITKETA